MKLIGDNFTEFFHKFIIVGINFEIDTTILDKALYHPYTGGSYHELVKPSEGPFTSRLSKTPLRYSSVDFSSNNRQRKFNSGVRLSHDIGRLSEFA